MNRWYRDYVLVDVVVCGWGRWRSRSARDGGDADDHSSDDGEDLSDLHFDRRVMSCLS